MHSEAQAVIMAAEIKILNDSMSQIKCSFERADTRLKNS